MNQIIYDRWTFSDNDITDGNPFREQALDGATLPLDTLTVTVRCSDTGLLNYAANSPVKLLHNGRQTGVFRLQSVSRVGADRYELSCASPLVILTQRPHAGGLYTGQTAQEIVADICGSLPVLVESVFADIQLYGWLPYVTPPAASARDNLARVLFALGASLGTDLNGVLRVEKLWDGEASAIPADRTYLGGSVQYDTPVSAVAVTEHQYVTGTEEAALFEGTAEAGYLITFSEPMHSLGADGFSILESGANYAVVSAGTGTLTGKKYVHNTRQVTQTATAGAAENVISVTDQTLVSVTNSVAAAQRLAALYRCRSTLAQSVTGGQEKAGHVVRAYDPFDRKMVSACIQSLDTTLSATPKAELTATVDFKPQQPHSAEYFNTRSILTGSGTIELPEGATSMTAVLIQAGQGGGCGHPGGSSEQKHYSFSIDNLGDIENVSGYWAVGGAGGEPGLPGNGGRILMATIPLTAQSVISYSCGTGGAPADYDPDNVETLGAEGMHTTLTVDGVTYTSADGSVSEAGYTDPVTGEVFAAKGRLGIPGGAGSGVDPELTNLESVAGRTPTPAGNVSDGAGNTWTGGDYAKNENGTIQNGHASYPFVGGYYRATVSYALGSGAAVGSNGRQALTTHGTARVEESSTSGQLYGIGCDGLAGADATQAPAAPTIYGTGGTSGHGGGGGSAPGYAMLTQSGSPSGISLTTTITPGAPGPGGSGSKGSAGAPGCLILFFHQETEIAAGPLVTKSSKWFVDRLGRRFIT